MILRKICVPMSGRYDPLDPENLDGPALRVALNYAKVFGAQVEVLCVIEPVAPALSSWTAWIPNYGVEGLFKEMQRLGDVRRSHARGTFERITKEVSGTIPCAFVEIAGDIGKTVGDAGRLADLIVLASSRTRWDMPFRPIMDASLRLSGRPVLVSPKVPLLTPPRTIALAWNNSAASARAMAAALPLIARPDTATTILACHEDGDETDLRCDVLVSYLDLHGVQAKVRLLHSDKRNSAQTILGAATDQGSDLLVAGGVIHSRAYSLIYGSLTEAALSEPKLPALLVP